MGEEASARAVAKLSISGEAQGEAYKCMAYLLRGHTYLLRDSVVITSSLTNPFVGILSRSTEIRVYWDILFAQGPS
jgi:hypothetical protein